MTEYLNPGLICKQSGQYAMFNSKHVQVNEVTCVKGEPLPPTPEHGFYYVLVDETKLIEKQWVKLVRKQVAEQLTDGIDPVLDDLVTQIATELYTVGISDTTAVRVIVNVHEMQRDG
jgi:hypothetical protein